MLARFRVLSLLVGLLFGVLFAATGLQAMDLYGCSEDYPEGPAFADHIEQSQIVSGELSFERVLVIGQKLFDVDFNTCDGRGRPASTGGGDKRVPVDQPAFLRTSAPDANSCAGCHNEPRSGGGGDFVANVFVLAQTLDPVVETVNGEFSNERNTLGMFGAGPIEMLAREMTADLQAIRNDALAQSAAENQPVTAALSSKGIGFGSITAFPDGTVDTSECAGVDYDLVVRPFHQAGRVVSLREFTVNAMNHHHGMQAEERFDMDPVKTADWDEDGIARELTVGDITAVTLLQAALATPGRLLPDDPQAQAEAERGEALFAAISCTSCHVPALPLQSNRFSEPNPYNPPGTWADTTQAVGFDMSRDGLGQRLEANAAGGSLVHAYTDLKRHNLCDPPDTPNAMRFLCNEQLSQGRHDEEGRPGTEFFLTRKLWDVGNSQPYGHRGDLTTLTEAILVHGGEGRASRDAFMALPTGDQAAVIAFLKTLQVLPNSDRLVMTESEAAAVLAGTTDNQPGLPVTVFALVGWIVALVALVLLLALLLVFRRARRQQAVSDA